MTDVPNPAPPTNPPSVQPAPGSRYRAWVFTLNNYTGPELDHLDQLACRYLLYGKEIAPETGTPHLQGYVYFPAGKSFAATRALLPRCHLLVARGTPSQNYNYCTKGGAFVERGDRPMDPGERGNLERDRYIAAWSSATEGRLLEIPEDIRIRHYGTLKRIARDFQPTIAQLTNTCGIWIHGESGCGKTRAVYARYPEAYPKPMSKWWDGYQGEETVLLDDIDPESRSWIGRFLKVWSDRYCFVAEDKGGSRKIRPERFIVTSQYSIEEIFSDNETRLALNRRFIVIKKQINQDIIL